LFVFTHILNKLKIIRKKEKNGGKLKKFVNYYEKYDDNLDLQPGELVEVKSEKDIRVTLDGSNRCKGLLFMPEMWKYCGKKFKVYKKLDKIIIENTSELRKIKNTVLLKDVICDGSEHYRCDRSCFHFWREAWLKKIAKDECSEFH